MKPRKTSPKADQTAEDHASVPSARWNRAVLGRVGLVAAGMVVALLLAEVGLRAAPWLLPRGSMLALDLFRARVGVDSTNQQDKDLGVSLKPNSDVLIEGHPDYRYRVKTYLNLPDRGFRGNVADRPLIGVALGDSFTFGTGVDAEEAWPEQLSQLAGQNVANLAVPAYGPPQYTQVLERYGLPLRPRVALYALYQNDLRDSVRFIRWRQEGGPYRSEPGEKRLLPENRFLARHSRLYQLILAPSVSQRFREADPEALIFQAKRLKGQQPKLGWEVAEQAILSARQITEHAGASFVLLLLPSKEQAYRHLLRERQAEYDLDSLNRLVRQLCETHRMRCLDLTPAFEARARGGERLYFRYDGHWNAEGHRLAAKTIYDYLAKNRLLETEQQRTGGKS